MRPRHLFAFCLLCSLLPAQASKPAATKATGPEPGAANSASSKVDKWVRDACGTHPIIQLQAARRVAKAGAEGVAAIERFVEKNGDGRLSSSLVETLGRADLPETRALLKKWLRDESFPWPPQALRALARIATEAERADMLHWSRHPAHVRRAAAMEGLGRLLGGSSEDARKELLSVLRRGLKDPHPFVRATAAAVLLPLGAAGAEAELKRALATRALWFGADLAQPTRRVAEKALRRAGIEAGGAELIRPARQPWSFGFEVVSCIEGDLYARLDEEGRLHVGLYRVKELPLEEAQRVKLLRMIAALPAKAPRTKARIYCDSVAMRGFGGEPKARGRWAPAGVPKGFAELKQELERLVAPHYRYRLEIGAGERKR